MYIDLLTICIVCIGIAQNGSEIFIAKGDTLIVDEKADWYDNDMFKDLIIKPSHNFVADIDRCTYQWVEEEQRKKWFVDAEFCNIFNPSDGTNNLQQLQTSILASNIPLEHFTFFKRNANFSFNRIYNSDNCDDNKIDLIVSEEKTLNLQKLHLKCMINSRCKFPTKYLCKKISQYDGTCDISDDEDSDEDADDNDENSDDVLSLTRIETDLGANTLHTNISDVQMNNMNRSLESSSIMHGIVNPNLSFVEYKNDGNDLNEMNENDVNTNDNDADDTEDFENEGDIYGEFVYSDNEIETNTNDEGWSDGVNLNVSF